MQISEEVNNTFWINNNISTPNYKCNSRRFHEFVYDYVDFYGVFTTPSQILQLCRVFAETIVSLYAHTVS